MLLNRTGPPVYTLRPGVVLDSYGDPSEDWANPVRARLKGATIQPVLSGDVTDSARTVLTDERVLFVAGNPPLSHDARVEYLGEVWRVDGTPALSRPLASGAYISATLRRVATS